MLEKGLRKGSRLIGWTRAPFFKRSPLHFSPYVNGNGILYFCPNVIWGTRSGEKKRGKKNCKSVFGSFKHVIETRGGRLNCR